jgi:Predicted RNA-binding protein (contains PUA domain)
MKSLDKKSRKNLIEILKNDYEIECKKLKNENIFLDEENNIYIHNNIPIAFIKDNKIYPTIFLINEYETNINYIKVNIGAKEKILNGADVFRPGIVEFSDFKKDEIILIISEDNKLLAIGRALYDSNDAIKIEKGKIIENIHYYGDKIIKYYLNKIKN